MTEEKRRDAPREGAMRYTIIVDRQLVDFLKNFSKKKQIRITDLIGDALEHWIERIKQNRERY
jgi:hypothetical protein